jgi:hypothetical protein
MSVGLKTPQPSSGKLERLSTKNRDFPFVEESKDLFMVLRARLRKITQRPVDPFVLRAPPRRLPGLATLPPFPGLLCSRSLALSCGLLRLREATVTHSGSRSSNQSWLR